MSGATGDQLSACIPLLWDSWSHQSAHPLQPHPPRAPLCPSARSDHHSSTVRLISSALSLLRGALLNFHVVANSCLFPGFQDKLCKSLTVSGIGFWFEYSLMSLAFGSHELALHLTASFMMPLMVINWYIVEPTPHSTCSHSPFSLCRWKALKPIIVFLEGRLPPWTLWHTFKESGLNVFRPDSQWLWHYRYHPPSLHTHTHTQLFFLKERVNMCESHCSLELFLVYQKGNWWAWQGTSKGDIKKFSLPQENFVKDTWSKSRRTQQLHTKTFYVTQICLLHNACLSEQHCWTCVSYLKFARTATIIRLNQTIEVAEQACLQALRALSNRGLIVNVGNY